MKIREYKEMMKYLTRPGTPEEDNRRVEQEKKFEKTKKENYQKDQTHLENYVKRTTALNENPGAFKRLVKENEKNNAMEVRGQQTIAITDTANKHLKEQIKKGNLKKEDLVLEQDKNGLMVNKNRTIAMRDSFMAKQFNRALGVNDEPMATPEQVGKLAERLEKNAQMTGGKGPFTKIADNLGKKPIIKKPIKKTPSKPFKFPEFKIDPMPIHSYTPHTPDPEFLRQERNFNRMVEESNKPKGLPGILGLKKSDYE